MMGFEILFAFVLFIGVKVEANPTDRCEEMIVFENQLDEWMKVISILNLPGEEQLNVVCANMTIYFECMNTVLKNKTGFNLKELANLHGAYDTSNGLALSVNLEEFINEICTEGTEFRGDYMSHIECFDSMDKDLIKQCKEQAQKMYEAFTGLEEGVARRSSQEIDEHCVMTAYQFACYGAAVHEDCGDEAYNVYKNLVQKIGFLKSGVCPSDLVHSMKTSMLESLNVSESRKNNYRVILDLKKRRK